MEWNPSLACQSHKCCFYTLTCHLSLRRSKSKELHVEFDNYSWKITLLSRLLIVRQDPVTSAGNLDQYRSMKLLWAQVFFSAVVALCSNAKGMYRSKSVQELRKVIGRYFMMTWILELIKCSIQKVSFLKKCPIRCEENRF